MEQPTALKSPRWWTDSHTSAWNKVKDAMQRDWEQTKADVSRRNGTQLKQNASDTLKQAAGTEVIPPKGVANSKPVEGFSKVEPAFRYGVGLSTQYASQKDWNPTFEGTLAVEWFELGTTQPWKEVKGDVQRGFERARRK